MDIYGPKKNTAFTAYVRLITYNGGDFQSNPTLATGDAKLSGDDGALGNLATLPSVSPAASIWVKVVLAASEMNYDVVKIQLIDQTATKEWEDETIVIYTTAQGLGAAASSGPWLSPTTAGRTLDVAAGGEAGIDIENVSGTVDTYTLQQTMRLLLAALAGKCSGGPASPIYRSADDAKARITAVATDAGNRTTVTLDAT